MSVEKFNNREWVRKGTFSPLSSSFKFYSTTLPNIGYCPRKTFSYPYHWVSTPSVNLNRPKNLLATKRSPMAPSIMVTAPFLIALVQLVWTTTALNSPLPRPQQQKQQRPLSVLQRRDIFVPLLSFPLVLLPISTRADEIGLEVDAPTLYTGETFEICKKRGILGACKKTVARTAENDNDKAIKYMRAKPAFKNGDVSRENNDYIEVRGGLGQSESEGSLIDELLRRSEENAERNQLAVDKKTFSATSKGYSSFLSREKMVMSYDGKSFAYYQIPQYEKLRKLGYINDQVFVKEPSEEILQATEPQPAFFEQLLHSLRLKK